MSRTDTAMAFVLGASISILDGLILSGPYLGLIGILLSFFIGALGWFAGTAAVHSIGAVFDQKMKKYRVTLWLLTLALSFLIGLVVILYFLFFVVHKSEYSYGEIFLHLLVLFVLATAIRTMICAAKIASDADGRQAQKGAANRPRERRRARADDMEPTEIIEVGEAKVACDGGKGALGHPRVFLNMAGKGRIDCPYCGRRFVLKEGAAGGGH